MVGQVFQKAWSLSVKFQATLSENVCYCITGDQTLSLHLIVELFCFCGFCSYDIALIKKRIVLISSVQNS
jgi:hypothetical protein